MGWLCLSMATPTTETNVRAKIPPVTRLVPRMARVALLVAIGALVWVSASFMVSLFAQPSSSVTPTATVTVGRKTQRLKPNSADCFPRVYTQPGQMVEITLHYPGADGQKLIVGVDDGGSLADGKAVQVLQLDRSGKATFVFQVGEQPGVYRLSLKRGKDYKALNFWAGEKP